jgi:hypothetical protein
MPVFVMVYLRLEWDGHNFMKSHELVESYRSFCEDYMERSWKILENQKPYSEILIFWTLKPSVQVICHLWHGHISWREHKFRFTGATKVPVDPSARQPIVGLQVFNDIETTRNHSFPQGEE